MSAPARPPASVGPSVPTGPAATAVIADDEAPLRDFLRKRLAALWPALVVVAEARNGLEAEALIAEHAPTVAFLDIKMPGLTGLEVAQRIRTGTRVVFVTAYDAYALDAFEREAVDYLVKPVATDRLARTVARLQRALAEAAPAPALDGLLAALLRQAGGLAVAAGESTSASSRPLRWIRASRGDTTVHVPVDEVRYVVSDDKYTVVHAGDGEHLIRMPLAELAASLDPERFWQIHRSVIVNLDHVAATRRDDGGRLLVVMRGTGAELPVSRAYAHRFRQM